VANTRIQILDVVLSVLQNAATIAGSRTNHLLCKAITFIEGRAG